MGQNLTNFDAILKEDYLGTIQDQINNSTILMQRLEKNEEDVGGKKAVVPLHTGRNSGVGARGDSGTLPTAGNQGYADATYNCAYNYARIQVSGPTIKASRKDKYAFVKAVDAEIQGATKDLKDDINRQLHGDGTGVLCLVNTDPGTGTTLTVDTPSTMYLQKGMRIDIVDPASTTASDARAAATNLLISAKTSTTAVTVSAALDATVADNDLVVRYGNYLREMQGLKGIVSDADPTVGGILVGGISRATAGNEFWKANVLANAGIARKLTLDLMQQAWDTAEEEGGEISLILTGRTQRRKYLALVKADGRFVNNLKLDGGWEALDYNGKPLVVDRHSLPGRMYFLDESTLALYRMSDVDWMNEDGAILSRVSGADAYEAVLFLYATLGSRACNRNALLDDLITA